MEPRRPEPATDQPTADAYADLAEACDEAAAWHAWAASRAGELAGHLESLLGGQDDDDDGRL